MNKRRLARPQLALAVATAFLFFLSALHISTAVAEAQEAGQTLIKNVRIFNGKDAKLSSVTYVLIVSNKIEQISEIAADSADANAKATT